MPQEDWQWKKQSGWQKDGCSELRKGNEVEHWSGTVSVLLALEGDTVEWEVAFGKALALSNSEAMQ